jgi:hypothetical protein
VEIGKPFAQSHAWTVGRPGVVEVRVVYGLSRHLIISTRFVTVPVVTALDDLWEIDNIAVTLTQMTGFIYNTVSFHLYTIIIEWRVGTMVGLILVDDQIAVCQDLQPLLETINGG